MEESDDTENFIMCSDCNNACTEDEKEDRQPKGSQVTLNIGI